MPTNRKRTSRSRRAAPIDSDDWEYLSDRKPDNPFTEFMPESKFKAEWLMHGERITEEWAAKYPGTRPSFWWKYSAPAASKELQEEWKEWDFSPDLKEPRRHLGGSGTPNDCMCYVHKFNKGVPNLDDDDIDQADPPLWETELAYLARHKLLLPGEGRRAISARDRIR